MSPRILTACIVAAFSLCSGIWATLVGYEYIGKSPDAGLDPRYAIRRRIYRLAGPTVVVGGLWITLQPIVAPLQGVAWEIYAPAGFGFSIEIPGRPEESVIEESGDYGPVKNHVATVRLPLLRTANTVVYIPNPKGLPALPVGLRKELLQDLIAKLVKTTEGTLVNDEEVFGPAGLGREFRIKLNEGLICRGQFWFLGHTRFQLMVVGPADLIDTDLSRRFFDSFSYDAPLDLPADSELKKETGSE